MVMDEQELEKIRKEIGWQEVAPRINCSTCKYGVRSGFDSGLYFCLLYEIHTNRNSVCMSQSYRDKQ